MKALFYKLLFCFVAIFVCGLLQFYWAVGRFADRMSSACMSCSFFEDAFMMSLIIAFFGALMFWGLFRIKNIYVVNCVAAVFLMSFWFFSDYSVFVERESSWSTYSLQEEIFVTMSYAFIPIVIMTLVCLFSIYFRNKRLIKNVE